MTKISKSKTKARILVTEACLRSCDGCCNTYSGIMEQMETLASLDGMVVDELLLTGGEPLLVLGWVKEIIKEMQGRAEKTYLYTAWFDLSVAEIMSQCDGVQFTIHHGAGLREVQQLIDWQSLLLKFPHKSYRLRIDSRVSIPLPVDTSVWTDIRKCRWLSEDELYGLHGPSGLPVGESLYFYPSRLSTVSV